MEQKSIEFHYLKSPDFKSFHTDGVAGGPTPSGAIFVSFFMERPAIPQSAVHSVIEQGKLGPEISRTGKKGIIRELQCGVVMNLECAKMFNLWLSEQIQNLEKK